MKLRKVSPMHGSCENGEKQCDGPERCVAEAQMLFLAVKPPGSPACSGAGSAADSLAYTLLIPRQMCESFPWGARMMALTSHFLLVCLIA